MRIKKGVRLNDLSPQVVVAVQIAEYCYEKYAHWNGIIEYDNELVVTSVNDSRHSLTSLHHIGHAVDLRTQNVTNPEKVRREISDRLGLHFDVLLEVDHMHIEYQPRGRRARG